MRTERTPGTWHVDGFNLTSVIAKKEGDRHYEHVCSCNFGYHSNESDFEINKANARLIAAAPELLEALIQLQKWHEKYPTGKTYPYDMIATVEGELTATVLKGIEAIKKATE